MSKRLFIESRINSKPIDIPNRPLKKRKHEVDFIIEKINQIEIDQKKDEEMIFEMELGEPKTPPRTPRTSPPPVVQQRYLPRLDDKILENLRRGLNL